MFTIGKPAAGMAVRLAVAPAVMALLAFTACGGDDDDTTSSTPSEVSETADEHGPTPLEEFLGSLWSEEDEEAWGKDLADVEKITAECMRSRGFEYIALDPELAAVGGGGAQPGGSGGGGEGGGVSDVGVASPGSEDVAAYGYGISTLDTEQEGGGDATGDPNEEIVAGMSEAEKAAYETALEGDGGDDGGCYGTAYKQIMGDRSRPEDVIQAEFSDLVGEADALAERAQRDDRIVGALEDWASCMADAGHTGFTTPDEAMESIQARFIEIQEAEGGASDDLATLQADEVKLAVADSECQASSELEQVRYEVQVELEQEFLDANREEFERMRDVVEQAGGAD